MAHINDIDVNFVKQYGRTLDLLTQTMGGKFKGKCMEESIEGESRFYDQLSSVTATQALNSDLFQTLSRRSAQCLYPPSKPYFADLAH